MNKMIKFGAGLVGLLMSATILAAGEDYNDQTTIMPGGAVDTIQCAILGTQVSLNLSSGVIAALHCRTIYGDAIVGTCHSSGNVNPTTETCGCNNISTTATPDYQKNISICPGTCDAITGTYTAADTATKVDKVLVAGRKAFGASTAGGQLQSYSLGDTGLCNGANLPGVSLFP